MSVQDIQGRAHMHIQLPLRLVSGRGLWCVVIAVSSFVLDTVWCIALPRPARDQVITRGTHRTWRVADQQAGA